MRYFINQILAATLYFIAAEKWLKAANHAENIGRPITARLCNTNAMIELWNAFDCLSRDVRLWPLIPYKEEDS